MNRIQEILDDLIGVEDPDDLMLSIMGALQDTVDQVAVPGNFYTFIYLPTTPNIQYDEHPLVACTTTYNWGFDAISYHWRAPRRYTFDEVAGNLYEITQEEKETLRTIPYQKFKLNI